MLKNSVSIADQNTDRSGAALVKIACRLNDQEVAEAALGTLFSMDREFSKTAEFPVDSPENVFLSRIYLEGQKDIIPQEKYAELDNRIGIYEALYGLDYDTSFAEMEKVADEERFDLLPGISVGSAEEVVQYGNDFSNNYNNLSYSDRLDFSENFCKVAELVDADIPEDVAIYAGYDIDIRPDVAEQMHFRKLACERAGKDGSLYEQLGSMLEGLDRGSASPEEMYKLACLVHAEDARNGFTDVSYDKRLPDAWHAVLCKHAEEDGSGSEESNDKPKDEMTKSDIVARFGDQALDEVENPDGTVNQKRLHQIMMLFGDYDQANRQVNNTMTISENNDNALGLDSEN